MKVSNDQHGINFHQKKQKELEQLQHAHQTEMNNLQKIQQQQKADMIGQGQLTLEQTKLAADQKNELQIIDQQRNLDAKLAQFQRQQEQLLSAEKLAKQHFTSKLADQAEKFQFHSQQMADEINDKNKTLQDDKRGQLEKITAQQQQEIQQLRNNSLATIQQEEMQYRNNLNHQRSQMAHQKSKEEFLFRQLENQSKEQQQKLTNTLRHKQESELKNLNRAHENQLRQIQGHHQEILQQSQKTFMEKAAQLDRIHQDKLATNLAKYQKEVSQQQDELRSRRQQLEKTHDPFYQVTKIEPTLTNYPKQVVVEVAIPEHEKELVAINAHDRKITISLGRRFQQREENPDGTINKTQRSEILSQDFLCQDLLDGHRITRQYHQGILSFAIPKK